MTQNIMMTGVYDDTNNRMQVGKGDNNAWLDDFTTSASMLFQKGGR